ncbi:MAG: FHA domain-containing protein [Acidobacteria bacterium]|nr:FHA domain-containing protein [Acidobacteriota bacterium]MBV9477281.1 FHA domain-containing protein [Acidobacteriota bacterium]
MADKRCENGHFIDESWDLCPYCPQDASEPEIPVVRPRAAELSPRAVASAAAPAPDAAPRRVTSSGSAAAVASPPPQQQIERTVASRLEAGAQQKRYVVGWLIGLNGASRGESFPVRMGRNVIGRDRRSDIVIADDQASSHHADLVFRPEERRYILMDHNSTNGTYVNEAEIEPRRDLIGKDVVRIGSHRFVFMPLCHDGFYWDDEGLLQ